MNELHVLAETAGILIHWRDVNGVFRTVADENLRAILGAIGLPAETDAEIRDSLDVAAREHDAMLPLITVELYQPVVLPGKPGTFKITLESGTVIRGKAAAHDGKILLPALAEPGYHQLEMGKRAMTIAAAPACGWTLEDAGGGSKMYGLAVQLYGLRRHGDGGIGDFTALATFARHASARGADAVAISPVHAQFSNDVTRFSPYAPSNRAALNVLHIGEEFDQADDDFVNWPEAAAAKLGRLRALFETSCDDAALAGFRREAGQGLEDHAVFEALAGFLARRNFDLKDHATWPEEFRSPRSQAVADFARAHDEDVKFHAWLQYRADAGLAAAQKAARDSGQRIGLIADLAVGTDASGSQGWSRPQEILQGLEIGAPPDLINREGQSWGITAFSPRGLRNSGFSAFIDMLRHALRHAGGVRIDHVMGLARLWIVPNGRSSAEGAYLTMPETDLLRLVVLESQRHKAVILGEDLGTLPDGFQEKLNRAGIAGLRVLWFERDRERFLPPAEWTKTAVAMTTTHDLPTVAGWWQGSDIMWREKLGMSGEDFSARERDRAALWRALTESGATDREQPPGHDGAAVTYPACAHLGKAGCALALLPVEDALSLEEQPNFPGTIDEHPNWRRRLKDDVETMFAREDFLARLDVLNRARKA
jgi:4-alpha-glucanotransferase